MADKVGERFAEALAAKDRGALLEVLDPEVDFQGLTPGRHWKAVSATALVDDVLLGAWFEDSDHVEDLVEMQVGSVEEREHFSYRLRVGNGEGTFMVEQQAYADVEHDRIRWLRIMCSGFQAVGPTTT